MDIADKAHEVEELWREAAIRDARRITREFPDFDELGHTLCHDCGEPIPVERLAAWPHAVRCIDCQEIADRRRSRP